LHCPYCGFQLEQTADLGRGRDAYGILACACHQYPIVEGIPILQQIDGLDRVVELIKGDEPRRALIQALRVFRIRWAHRSRWHRALYYLNCRRLVSDAAVTFEDAAQLVRTPKAFADYLIHRYANPSFLAAIGPLMLLEHLGLEPEEITGASGSRFVGPARRTPRVLDLACGAGHASFLMALLHPGLSVVSADQDFVSLYLAKRFVAPEATHVCWDVEAPSPFPEDYFDAVFCLDAFHYFKSKRAVVSELKRIATADALWLFPHLHNGRQHNLVAGIPLSPEKYLECFALAEGRLFDETEILHGLSQQRVVDLRSQPPSSQLNQARTLTFVRGGRAVWRAYNRFPLAFCADTSLLTVNPIYRGLWQGDILELRLTWPNDSIRRECSSVTAVLRSTYQLNKADLRYLRDLGTTPDWDHLGDLIAKFVLVPLPRRYQRVDLTALGDVSRRVASVN
jgi:SAM-dependent methyltransferase